MISDQTKALEVAAQVANLMHFRDLELLLKEFPQEEIPVEHISAGDVYIRQMAAPADTIILGKRHREKSCNILLSGEMLLHDGKQFTRVKGPYIFESPKMTRKLAYTITEVIFLNIFPNLEKKDLDELERELIVDDMEYARILDKEARKCLS